MSSSNRDPVTSLPVHRSTLRLLQNLKTGAQTWDDFFREWAERELDRLELSEAARDVEDYLRHPDPGIPLSVVRRTIRSRRSA